VKNVLLKGVSFGFRQFGFLGNLNRKSEIVSRAKDRNGNPLCNKVEQRLYWRAWPELF